MIPGLLLHRHYSFALPFETRTCSTRAHRLACCREAASIVTCVRGAEEGRNVAQEAEPFPERGHMVMGLRPSRTPISEGK